MPAIRDCKRYREIKLVKASLQDYINISGKRYGLADKSKIPWESVEDTILGLGQDGIAKPPEKVYRYQPKPSSSSWDVKTAESFPRSGPVQVEQDDSALQLDRENLAILTRAALTIKEQSYPAERANVSQESATQPQKTPRGARPSNPELRPKPPNLSGQPLP